MMTGEMLLDLPGQRALLNEWIANSQDGRPACRNALQPARFVCQLAYISVIEDCDDGELRFRLSGSEIRRQLGAEARGRRIGDFKQLSISHVWSDAVREALRCRKPVSGVYALGSGLRHFWLRLPVFDSHGGMKLVMCHDRIIDDETLKLEISGQFRERAA